MFSRLFLEHPRSVGEDYWTHQRAALRFSGRLLTAAWACLVHAAVPGLHRTTASDTIRQLHDEMVIHRRSTARREGA